MYQLTINSYIPTTIEAEAYLKDVYGSYEFQVLEVNKALSDENECRHTVNIEANSKDEVEDVWFNLINSKGINDWSLKFIKKIN